MRGSKEGTNEDLGGGENRTTEDDGVKSYARPLWDATLPP